MVDDDDVDRHRRWLVRGFADAFADPNARNMAGNTALHFAAQAACADAAHALINGGAERGARNAYGATALDIEVRDGRDAAADALRTP